MGDQDLDPAHLYYRQELRLIEQHAGPKEAMDKIVESRSDLHYQYELEKAAQDEVRHRLEDKHLLLAREVERKYYTILELDKAHDSLQKSLDYLLKQQDSENKRVSLGLSTPLSLQRLGAQVKIPPIYGIQALPCAVWPGKILIIFWAVALIALCF